MVSTTNRNALPQGGSQVKRNVAKKVARRKRRVVKRLERARGRRFIRGLASTSVIGANAVPYELSERVHAIGLGGIRLLVLTWRPLFSLSRTSAVVVAVRSITASARGAISPLCNFFDLVLRFVRTNRISPVGTDSHSACF